jgi:hypothetical protein
MDNYPTWIDLKAEVLELRTTFQDPRLRAIAFDYKVDNQFLFIVPKCVVTKPPSNMIGLLLENRGNITVESSDYYVKSVPRDFPKEAFKFRCFIDAEVVNNTLKGLPCRVHYIDDKKGLHYNLILKKEIEKRS